MDNFEKLELKYVNGGCSNLASYFNKKYGWKIFHIVVIEKLLDDEEEDSTDLERSIPHTLNKLPDGRYFDVYGYQDEKQIISSWRYNLQFTKQTHDFFLCDELNCPTDLLKQTACSSDYNQDMVEKDAEYILNYYNSNIASDALEP